MSSDVIRPGHVRWGYVEAVPRLHGSLLFQYRPMLATDVEATEAEHGRVGASIGQRLIAAQIKTHLVSWDEGAPEAIEPITVETIQALIYPKLGLLYRIIAGLRPSDPHRSVDGDPARGGMSYADTVLAAAEGKTAGQAINEHIEGN